MITDNLFEQILIQPAREGATELLIVSGYAEANMAEDHISELDSGGLKVHIKLMYGMAKRESVSRAKHNWFQQIEKEQREKHKIEKNASFQCYYVTGDTSVHSKVYIWMKNGRPQQAFVGSANYTRPGFKRGGLANDEVITEEGDPRSALNYYGRVGLRSSKISAGNIENHVSIHERGPQSHDEDECRTVSLLTKRGDVAKFAGLNWGQSPNFWESKGKHLQVSSSQNAAYIQIGNTLAKQDFFPTNQSTFTVKTDDGYEFKCVRAQKDSVNGHAIETPDDNSQFGTYFRNRLGVNDGEAITRKHLEDYGRHLIEFCKINCVTFRVDFSRPPM